MTSSGPYSESLNYTHMFDFTDIRGQYPTKTYNSGSIMSFVNNNIDMTFFRYLIKLAGLDTFLDDPQANLTIFIPSDVILRSKGINETNILNIQRDLARTIVNSSIMTRQISRLLLQNSPASYFNTIDGVNRMFITNIDDNVCINDYIYVIGFDIECNNGIIHIVDTLISPLQL